MISTHPYSTWPLHVKLFSDEAVAAWKAAARDSAPMPPGFTCSIELEGVDGKSGKVGSGRREPISVKDGTYRIPRSIPPNPKQSSPQNNSPLPISQKTLPYSPDALSTALCPNPSCTATSHITCLSRTFLASDSSSTALVPRGGKCPSCNTYTLWGDIIRGSYRRLAGKTSIEIDDDDDDEEEDLPSLSEDEPYASDNERYPELPPTPKRNSTKTTSTKTRKPRQKAKTMTLSSDGEDGVGSTDETRVVRRPKAVPVSSEGELFDSDSSSLDEPLLKCTTTTTKHIHIPLPNHVPVPPRKRGRPRKVPSKDYSTVAGHTISSDSSGEFFDFDAVESGSFEDDLMPGPRGLGRLRSSREPDEFLNRAMSSMSVSSQSPTREPRHVEISD
ncbi:hypothetical protein C0989_003272 [Termitomyces sp. Mn162]|nr:hypothetical protein C0989_003272 [Termitomyces sp. Mn162]